jgi:hypothetical protein
MITSSYPPSDQHIDLVCIFPQSSGYVPRGRDDLFSATMCGILFHARIGKAPDTESDEFLEFLNRLTNSNSRRGESQALRSFVRSVIHRRVIKAQIFNSSWMYQSDVITGMTYFCVFLPRSSNYEGQTSPNNRITTAMIKTFSAGMER